MKSIHIVVAAGLGIIAANAAYGQDGQADQSKGSQGHGGRPWHKDINTVSIEFPKDHSIGQLFLLARANPWESNPHQSKFVEAQGTVKIPAEAKLYLAVSFYGAKDLSVLAKIKTDSIVALDFRELENLDNNSLRFVRGMTSLKMIVLDDTDVTDACLEFFTRLDQLNFLSLNRTLVTGSGLAQLNTLPHLERLSMASTRLKDNSLECMKELVKLRHLKLHSCDLGDVGLKYISKLQSLEELDLSDNKHLGNQAMVNIPVLPKLQKLNIVGTSITGACADSLAHLSSLRELKIGPVQFGFEEIRRLKQALPLCNIAISKKGTGKLKPASLLRYINDLRNPLVMYGQMPGLELSSQ